MPRESTRLDLAECVRVIMEAADRADFDAILGFFAEDAVWRMPEANLVFEGPQAIREFWQSWYGSYERFRVRVAEVVDVGNGVTLATGTQGGRPVGGAADLQEGYALIYEWRDGLVVRATAMSRRDEALLVAERLAGRRG
jgi:ketosteroid isomerase-like protein